MIQLTTVLASDIKQLRSRIKPTNSSITNGRILLPFKALAAVIGCVRVDSEEQEPEDYMTNADRQAEKWRELAAEAALDLDDDLGDHTLTGEDLAYEVVVTSLFIDDHSDRAGTSPEEFVGPCLSYLRRSFAIAQKVFDSRTSKFKYLWTKLGLAYSLIELRQADLAVLRLDEALVTVNELSKQKIEPYGTLSTVLFIIRKYKERHGYARTEQAEEPRTIELGAILNGVRYACGQLRLDIRSLSNELAPLFQDYYDKNIPDLSAVEALERALMPPIVH